MRKCAEDKEPHVKQCQPSKGERSWGARGCAKSIGVRGDWMFTGSGARRFRPLPLFSKHTIALDSRAQRCRTSPVLQPAFTMVDGFTGGTLYDLISRLDNVLAVRAGSPYKCVRHSTTCFCESPSPPSRILTSHHRLLLPNINVVSVDCRFHIWPKSGSLYQPSGISTRTVGLPAVLPSAGTSCTLVRHATNRSR